MGTPTASASLAELSARLPELMLRDQRRIERRLDGARRMRDRERQRAVAGEIAADVERAEQRVALRAAAVPKVSYPAELPISIRRDDIAAAIRDNQVVIVAGETGSGKTTQLPKICLELGRGVRGLIGHTQPRRLAARTVADRVAEELRTPLGEAVGWKVRFTDQVGENTLVKLMTDGILLAELQSDRALRQYDTLIIDEAHERSLNIDFILGYLKRLLPRRPDLKVIITSATIDPERFSRHFGDAPIVEVSGRTYPVEVRYRPIVDPEDENADPDRDQTQAILDAVDELASEPPGDVLVFLSGEREIRDTAEALAKHTERSRIPVEVLPLYARLSVAEQHRVFTRHGGRRVVLATNVAETSLTVPGIRYVVDPGTARISRYSNRLKVQRLPIEPVSQASANQRKGRCGRVADGVCIRLYSEEDFESRPEFTDPEILRTNLASVVLQMAAADLGDLAEFPFVEPPDKRNVADGVNLLHELGALDPSEKDVRKQLTPLGRKLAQLPVDPRLARMVIEADRNGCLAEVMVIAAALSIQDPRERPTDHQQAADEKHARFADKGSDFLSYLNLWRYLAEQQKELSGSRFRRQCKSEFLNYLRVREWQDVHHQLRQVARTLDLTPNRDTAQPDRIHVSLLSGLLSHIGLKDTAKNEYLGARGARFAVFPGSALFKKPPRWVMAAELVETSRLWARIAAHVEPDWIEPIAGHLVKRTYSEPHWERKQGGAMATERVTLYGIPIVVDRKVHYGRIDPETSRELFIRHALVEGDWQTRHAFFHANRKLMEDVEELEHRARRRDILVDDETLFDFYDKRVGTEVVSARHFDTWWKKTRREQPGLLDFDTEMLVNADAGGVSERDFPDTWSHAGQPLPLSYRFQPGDREDGVTVHVPLAVLNKVGDDGFAWHVPGLREDLVTALIKSLPKALRRNFVPAPDFARAALAAVKPDSGPMLEAVGRELTRLTGVPIPRDAWQLDQVPDHLRVNFRVIDEQDRTVGEGKDLGALRSELTQQLRASLSKVADDIEAEGLREWSFGTLPRKREHQQSGYTVTAYPALVDTGDSVAIRMLDTPAEQRRAMLHGTRRLLLLTVPAPNKTVIRQLSNSAKLALSSNPHGGVAELLADCTACAVDALVAEAGGPVWDQAAFAALRASVAAGLPQRTFEVVGAVRRVLDEAHEVALRLAAVQGAIFAPALADVRRQLAALVHAGFVTETGAARLADLPRYLQAARRRLEKLTEKPDRDREWMAQVEQVERAYRELPPGAEEIRWMIEELRVSYFAQELKTPYPVSPKRIYRAMDELTGH